MNYYHMHNNANKHELVTSERNVCNKTTKDVVGEFKLSLICKELFAV